MATEINKTVDQSALDEGYVIPGTDTYEFECNQCGIEITGIDRGVFIDWTQMDRFINYLDAANKAYKSRICGG